MSNCQRHAVFQFYVPILKNEDKIKIYGPEPGYDGTSKILIAAVRALMEDREKILENLGGAGAVTTTAFAFNQTSLVSKLEERGIRFELLQF